MRLISRLWVTQRVSAKLAELGHPHPPVMLADSARTAQDAARLVGWSRATLYRHQQAFAAREDSGM